MNQSTSEVSESAQNETRKPDAAARWRRVVEDHRDSGLPVSAFCKERGIAPSSLFAWRRRLSRGVTDKFVEVKAADDDGGESKSGDAAEGRQGGVESAANFVELRLVGDRRLIVRRGFDRRLLLDLIDALESRR